MICSFDDQFSCRTFIDRVRSGKVWCPHVKYNIPLLSCVNPPSKRELTRLVKHHVTAALRQKDPFVTAHKPAFQELLKLLEKPTKSPNRDWLMTVLMKVPGKQCVIFQKGYKPPKKERVDEQPVYIDNSDGFFDNLEPVSNRCQAGVDFRMTPTFLLVVDQCTDEEVHRFHSPQRDETQNADRTSREGSGEGGESQGPTDAAAGPGVTVS